MATPTPERSAGAFPATHWSVVFTAGHGGSTDADAALANLCRTYWYPLYAFARREGHAPEDAQDLTQGFFEHLIETRLVEAAEAARGKFRTFLLHCFRQHAALLIMPSWPVRSCKSRANPTQ